MDNIEITREEMDTILDCVMEEQARVLKERLDAPSGLKTIKDGEALFNYIEHNKALDERADYLQGIINKLTYLCKADDLQEAENNKE